MGKRMVKTELQVKITKISILVSEMEIPGALARASILVDLRDQICDDTEHLDGLM